MTIHIGPADQSSPVDIKIEGRNGKMTTGPFGPAECSLDLAFDLNVITVNQNGPCASFGLKSSVSGHYVLRAAGRLDGKFLGPSGTVEITESNDDTAVVEFTPTPGGTAKPYLRKMVMSGGGESMFHTENNRGYCTFTIDASLQTLTADRLECAPVVPPGPYLRTKPEAKR